MKLADRYIFRELTMGWIGVTAVLALALLVNQLAQILAQSAERGYPHRVILPLIALMSLQNLTVLIPVGLLLGIVLSLGRLYHEREMDALGACGYGPVELLQPVLRLAAVVVLLLMGLGLELAPQAFHQAELLRQEAVRLAPISQLEPKVFHRLAHDSAVFYADDTDEAGQFKRVFIAHWTSTQTEVVFAEQAHLERVGSDQQLWIDNGVRYDIPIQGLRVERTHFERQVMALELNSDPNVKRRVEGRGLLDLIRDPDTSAQAEWQWRVSMPLMALLLALWSIPLAKLAPREGRYSRAFLVILIYFLYANMLTAARTWLEKGSVPMVLGLWWVHLLVGVAVLITWQRSLRWR